MERIVIVGASIAGISTALALQERGFKVTLLERDAEPDLDMDAQALIKWSRKGVSHAMQPHVFISALRNELLNHYPELVTEFERVGILTLSLEAFTHPSVAADKCKAHNDDHELQYFGSRRKMVDLALYRYIARQPNIDIKFNTRVLNIITEGSEAPFVVKGLTIKCDGEQEIIETDRLIDASGRTSKLLQPVIEQGACIEEERYVSKSVYYTRHYRLHDGIKKPDLMGLPGVIFDDVMAITFLADNNTLFNFLVVSQDDPLPYADSIQKPEVFEKVMGRIPKVARWSHPGVSEPISPVFGWTGMDYFWRSLIADGQPQIVGYFPVGDTIVRGSPRFGRGCAWGFLGGRLLADCIATESDNAVALQQYENSLRQTFRSDWETMLAVEKEDRIRFEAAAGLRKKTLKLRIISKLNHWVANIATSVDPRFYRELLRGFYGNEPLLVWTKKPVNWWRMLMANLLPSPARSQAAIFSQRPDRDEIQKMLD